MAFLGNNHSFGASSMNVSVNPSASSNMMLMISATHPKTKAQVPVKVTVPASLSTESDDQVFYLSGQTGQYTVGWRAPSTDPAAANVSIETESGIDADLFAIAIDGA